MQLAPAELIGCKLNVMAWSQLPVVRHTLIAALSLLCAKSATLFVNASSAALPWLLNGSVSNAGSTTTRLPTTSCPRINLTRPCRVYKTQHKLVFSDSPWPTTQWLLHEWLHPICAQTSHAAQPKQCFCCGCITSLQIPLFLTSASSGPASESASDADTTMSASSMAISGVCASSTA